MNRCIICGKPIKKEDENLLKAKALWEVKYEYTKFI